MDVQGYPVAEVARILGVAEGTVKSRCARGRARLAVLLGHLRTGSDAATDMPHVTGGNRWPPEGVGSTSGRSRRDDASQEES